MTSITGKSIEKILCEKGYKLLGQIPITEEDYCSLIEYAKTKVKYICTSCAPSADLMLSLALVQVAIRHYKDGRYWQCFLDEIEQDLSSLKLNHIGQIFSATIKKYGLLELSREDNSSQMYVENIKAHAFVTNYYMPGFFDFAYAFFENNLFRDLSNDISEDLDALSDFMKTTMKSKKDLFSAEESGKKTAKTYKLLKSTRSVFVQGSFQTIYAQFYPVLELIDKYYYDNEIPTVPQTRYEMQFVEWCKNKEIEDDNKQNKKGSRYRRIVSHRPYIQVDIEKEKAILVIPAQKFREEECTGAARVAVSINGYTEERNLELYRSFGIYISEEMRILIPNIFEEINVAILSLTEKKHKFPKSNYRIFNSNWEGCAKFYKGHNYMLVKPGVAVRWEDANDVIDYTDMYTNWEYYSLNIQDSSLCYVGNKPVSIIGEFSSEPIFETLLEHFEVYNDVGRKIIATREHPGISFVVNKQKINGSVLLINDMRYPVKEIKEKIVYEWPEDKNKIAVNIALENILPAQEMYCHISLDVPGETERKICEYILLKRFNCRLNKPKYIYSDNGSLSIKKSEQITFIVDSEWKNNYETEKDVLYEFPIEEDTDNIEFAIQIKESLYKIRVPVIVFRYGFSPTSMTIKKHDYIWYADLGESLYVYLPDAKNMFAYWGRDTENRYYAEELNGNMFRIDISELKRIIKQKDKIRWQYINLKYIDGKERGIALPPILRNIEINPYFKLCSDGDNVYMDLDIKGEGELYLTVLEHYTKKVLIDNRKITTGRNDFLELSAEGLYDIIPTMEEADEFGFDTERTKMRALVRVGCLDMNNLSKCRFVIKEVLVDEKSLPLEYRYFVNTHEKIGDNEYLGAFYRVELIDGRENWEHKKLYGTVKIYVYQKEEDIKISLIMYSKDEDSWAPPYYDKQRHFILGCDNRLIYTEKDYNRFVPLEEEYTEYIVDREKLRRVQ